MNRWKIRVICAALAVALGMGLVPATAWAEEAPEEDIFEAPVSEEAEEANESVSWETFAAQGGDMAVSSGDAQTLVVETLPAETAVEETTAEEPSAEETLAAVTTAAQEAETSAEAVEETLAAIMETQAADEGSVSGRAEGSTIAQMAAAPMGRLVFAAPLLRAAASIKVVFHLMVPTSPIPGSDTNYTEHLYSRYTTSARVMLMQSTANGYAQPMNVDGQDYVVSGWTDADGNPVSFTYVLNYDDAVQMADDSNTVNIFFYAQYRKLMPNVHYEVIRADIRQTNGTMKDNVITADLYDAGSHTKALEGGAGISNRVSYMGYVYEYTGDWTDGEHNVIYDDESDVDGNILRGPKAQINIINREGVSDPLTGIYYLNGVDNTRLTFRPIYIATMIQGLNVYYEDHVSTGSGSWSNRNAYEYNAEFSSMTHTFKDPSVATPTPHYQFLRWDMTGNTSVYTDGRTVENSYSGPYVAGGQYTYSINSGLPEGTVTTVRFAAVWQPSVTVQYHVPGSLAGSEGEYTQMEAVEKFDRVSVYEDFAAPEYEGAVFLGWFDEDGNLLSEETVYTAPEETTDPVDRYIVNVYAHYSTDYTVEHYLEDLDGTFGLDEASTETENGVIGTRVEAAAKEFPGFTLDRTVEGTVDAADLAVGTVLRLYYTRNVHKVTYAYTGDVPSGAPGVPAETTYRYGESVPAAALPALEGYTFSGWSGEVSTMPDSDVRVTGSWRQNPPAPVEPTTEADETTAPTDETTAPAEETTAPEPAPTPGPAPAPGPAPSPAPTPVPAVIPPSPVPAAPPEEADVNEPTAEETDDTEDPGSGGEIIEDETVPLAPGAEGRGRDHWALVNLICTVVTVVTAVGMVVTYFRKKDDDDDGDGGKTAAEGSGLPQDEEEKDEQKRRKSKFLGLIPGVGSVIAFLLTEDMRLPMQLTDKWTVLMIIIALIGIILAIATKNKKKDDEDREDRAETMA